MTRFVFGAGFGDDFAVVLGFYFRIGDRVGLEEIFQLGLGQD